MTLEVESHASTSKMSAGNDDQVQLSEASSLADVTALLIDISGTIHVENEALPGTLHAVKRLQEARIPYLFVTNTTKESLSRLHRRLVDLGFPISPDEIFSSLSAAKHYVVRHKLRPWFMLEDEALEDLADVDTSDPNAVVIGLAPSKFNYDNLTKAFRMLQTGAELVAIHKSRYIQRSDGRALGPGCFVAGLEFSSSRQAVVVGKPERTFFESALDALNAKKGTTLQLEKPDVVMIGDDAKDDVWGAQAAGFKGCLVRSGKYERGDELKFPVRPNFVFDSFTEFVEAYLSAVRPTPCS